MKKSFWQDVPRPCFVLAPMADVTDPAYRALIARTGKPDVTWTEFVSADGLWHLREKQQRPDEQNPLMRDLAFTHEEHPIVAQLFGANTETMQYAARLCAELGFDGIDLNMGCPDKAIEKQGCGAGMMRMPEVAKAIYVAASTSGLPVSIKTRIGYNHEEIDTWLRFVLALNPPALTVHLRTRKEMSKVPAHWELMPRIVALRDEVSPETLIIGNGDVKSVEEAQQKVAETGCDGVMLGRSIFGNPWLFSGRDPQSIPATERLHALADLTRAFSELKPAKSFHILKKHVKAFVVGFDGAAELRAILMETADVSAFLAALEGHALYS